MGRVELGEFVNLMTQTQPDPLLKKFMTQPNQPPLKTDPTW